MNIFGLGDAGASFTNKLSQYRAYNLFTATTASAGGETPGIILEEHANPEEYEKNTPEIAPFDSGPTVFVLDGSEAVSGCALRFLAQCPTPVTVLYFKRDASSLSHERQVYHRVAYNVLQEYARSALVDNIVLVSYGDVDELLGGVTLLEYFDQIHEFTAQHYHMINVLEKSKPILDTFSQPEDVARIRTFGAVDFTSFEHRLVFPLDKPRELVYFYAVPEERLRGDRQLLKQIKEQVSSVSKNSPRVSYGIYPTEYEAPLVYCWAKTNLIQE